MDRQGIHSFCRPRATSLRDSVRLQARLVSHRATDPGQPAWQGLRWSRTHDNEGRGVIHGSQFTRGTPWRPSSELVAILDDAYQRRLRHRVRNTTHRAVSRTLSCESAREHHNTPANPVVSHCSADTRSGRVFVVVQKSSQAPSATHRTRRARRRRRSTYSGALDDSVGGGNGGTRLCSSA